MDLILTAVVAGVLGTIMMDILNHLFARAGIVIRIDLSMIGRMSTGWFHGRFLYSHPSEMQQVAYEKLYGYITHYAIGVGLAIPFVLGWAIFIGGPVSPVWALTYGVATTVACARCNTFMIRSFQFKVTGLPNASKISTFFRPGIATGTPVYPKQINI